MVSEDSNTSEISVSEILVITPEDIEAGENRRDIVHSTLTGRDTTGYLKDALPPALVGGLLLGLFLSSAGATMAWIGGLLGVAAILGLGVLAGHKGWIKQGTADSAGRIEPGVESITPPVILMPPVIIQPDEIPAVEPDSEAKAAPGITVERDELNPETAVTEEETICPYCGEALGARPQNICRHCKTPHHSECWRANRGCTTLGCRSANSRN